MISFNPNEDFKIFFPEVFSVSFFFIIFINGMENGMKFFIVFGETIQFVQPKLMIT
jgi:hypothetical protein